MRTVSAVGHLDIDGRGEPLRQYGVMFDVTERLEGERSPDAPRPNERRKRRGRASPGISTTR